MSHLSPPQLLDAAEGVTVQADRSRRHLAACGRCQADVDALRVTLAEARIEPPAEPSPLFWDHFADRVGAAVRDETPEARAGAWWHGRPTAAWAAALLIGLASATITWRTTLHAPAPGRVAAAHAAVAAPATGVAATGEGSTDHAWGAVRDAVDELRWDDVQAAGMIGGGIAERAAAELSAEERAELARLIATEMTQGGA